MPTWTHYQRHLANNPNYGEDSYDKPWLSPVSVAECFGAASLGGVGPDGDDTEEGHDRVSRAIPALSLSAMSHQFGYDLLCTKCGVTWEEHQRLRVFCHIYRPARLNGSNPRENPFAQKRRIDKINALYPA